MEPPKNSIPVVLQSLLEDLHFLSQIQRNMKPCCNDRVFVDADGWYQTFYRRYKGESRTTVMSKIEQIVNSAIEAIENQKYNEHLSLTINALYEASNGILNLAYTYDKDPNMKSKINVQMKNINIQLDRFRHLIKGFRPEDVINEMNKFEKICVEEKNEVKSELKYEVKSEEAKEAKTESTNTTPSPGINLLDSTDFERKRFKKPSKVKKSIEIKEKDL